MITNATMTIRCTVLLTSDASTGDILTVTNEKSVAINLTAARKAGMTEEETGLIDWLTDGLPPGRSDTADLSIPAMRVLASLWQRFPATASQPAPTPGAASNPLARPRPVPVQPSRTERRTAERVVNAHTNRTAYRPKGNGEADHVEARADQLTRAADITSFSIVHYDIDEETKGPCPNPSWRTRLRDEATDEFPEGEQWYWPGMHRFAFRLTKSCWIIDTALLPGGEKECPLIGRLFRHWERHGIEFHYHKFASSEMENFRALARRRLDELLQEVHTSLIDRLGKASEELARVQVELSERARLGQATEA
jgi:hypothetical protein